MTHREVIKDWLANIELKDCLIIDWGSGSKPVSRYIKHHNCKFLTIDKNPLIAGDRRSIHHLEKDIQLAVEVPKADVAFCIEVLEHTLQPHGVISNLYNNLKDGGKLYLTMPYNFRVHSDDDYIRLTENGLRGYLEYHGFKINYIKPTNTDEGFLVEAFK